MSKPDTPPAASPAASESASDAGKPRRSFLYRAMTIVVSAAVGLGPLLTGLAVFFDPLRKRGSASADDEGNWLRIANIDAVPDDGVPRQFPVIADQIDAWNRTPNQPIGLLYLRRAEGEANVEVFTAVCPHAGCNVGLVEKNEQLQYLCPCHNSAFDLTGEKIESGGTVHPSPRDMDKLEVDQEKLAETGEVWVDFKNFYPGKHERVEKK